MAYTNKQKGFTLVEVAVVLPILILTVITLFWILFTMIRSNTVERVQSAATYDVQTALSIIENDSLLTSTFKPTIDSAATDPYQPSGGWSYRGQDAQSRVLILRAYATTSNPLSSDRQPVFYDDSGCDPSNIFFNDVLQYNIVYFVKDETLYRRKVLDTSGSTCTPPYQKISCPSLETLGTTSRDGACVADDEVIATNVTNFSVEYYNNRTSTTPIDVYAVDADSDLVTIGVAVTVHIDITRSAYGKNTTASSALRMTKLNVNPQVN